MAARPASGEAFPEDAPLDPGARVLLVNPNSSVDTSTTMLALARREAGRLGLAWTLDAATGADVPPVLLDADDLRLGERAVSRILHAAAMSETRPDAVIVAAFADPALGLAKSLWHGLASGIGEAGLREGGARGAFAVVTTTPAHVAAVDAAVVALGLSERWLGVHLSDAEPGALMADEPRLIVALQGAIDRATAAGARAVVIGGGPLARHAHRLATPDGVELVEPVAAAVRDLSRRLRPGRTDPEDRSPRAGTDG